MWIIYGEKMVSIKSINFTHLKEDIESGKKQQTCRINFIPYYKPNELTALTFEKAMIFLAPITNYYPKRLIEVNETEAKRDGFKEIREFREKICEINNIDDLNHYCFLINWDYEKREIPIKFDGKYYHFRNKNQTTIEVFMNC